MHRQLERSLCRMKEYVGKQFLDPETGVVLTGRIEMHGARLHLDEDGYLHSAPNNPAVLFPDGHTEHFFHGRLRGSGRNGENYAVISRGGLYCEGWNEDGHMVSIILLPHPNATFNQVSA